MLVTDLTLNCVHACGVNNFSPLSSILLCSQEQYIFVHQAVLEALTRGSTCIEASQLEAALTELSAPDPQLGCSGLEEEFAILEEMTPRPEHSACRTAMQHPRKNRSMDYLPSKCTTPSENRAHIQNYSTSIAHSCNTLLSSTVTVVLTSTTLYNYIYPSSTYYS